MHRARVLNFYLVILVREKLSRETVPIANQKCVALRENNISNLLMSEGCLFITILLYYVERKRSASSHRYRSPSGKNSSTNECLLNENGVVAPIVSDYLAESFAFLFFLHITRNWIHLGSRGEILSDDSLPKQRMIKVASDKSAAHRLCATSTR